MQLSADTIAILENYGLINPNLLLKKGNQLSTLNTNKTVFSTTHIEESFPLEFGIYDVKEFLSTLGIYKSPVLEFQEKVLSITDSEDPTLHTSYYSAQPGVIADVKVISPENLPPTLAKFTLTNKDFRLLEKGSGTLKLHSLKFKSVVKDGVKTIKAIAYDESNASKNTFEVTLCNDYKGEDFDVHVKMEKMTIITGDYDVSVIASPNNPPKALYVKNRDKDLFYVIALDVDTE